MQGPATLLALIVAFLDAQVPGMHQAAKDDGRCERTRAGGGAVVSPGKRSIRLSQPNRNQKSLGIRPSQD